MPQQIIFTRNRTDKPSKSKTRKEIAFEDTTVNDEFFVELCLDSGEGGPPRGYLSEDQAIELRDWLDHVLGD